MTVVLLDQEMDRAEAFRLSKRIRLPPEVVLSSDGSIPRRFVFYRTLGLDSYPVVRRMMSMQLDIGMSETLGSVDVPYADRLSHLVDLDDPVTFVDLHPVLESAMCTPANYVPFQNSNRPGDASGEREPPSKPGGFPP